MDLQQQRGRSPSVGATPGQRIRHPSSPHHLQDPASNIDIHNSGANLTSQTFAQGVPSANGNGGGQYNISSSYLNPTAPQTHFSQPVLPSNDFGDQPFGQTYTQEGLNTRNLAQGSNQLNAQSNQQYPSDLLNVNQDFNGFTQQSEGGNKPARFDNAFALDPQLQGNAQAQDQSINPADIMSNMSSPQVMHPTPPGLLAPNAHSSEPTSPFSNPGQHWSPNHSRQASLDPTMAYMNGQQTDWTRMLGGQQFQTHRRAPSEYSDVSSSVAPSPHIAQPEAFDNYDQSRSPLVRPQSENQGYTDGLGIENFSIADPQPGASPRHSPFVSPMISPQPGLGPAQDHSFMPLEAKNGFSGNPATKAFPPQAEQFPQFPPEKQLPSNDYGQGPMVPPPEINVELAPPSNQRPFDHPRFDGDVDALSPPQSRGRGNRMRAKSDTYISRPVTPSSPSPSMLGSNDGSVEQRQRSGSLSPFDVPHSPMMSRESSRSSSQRRSSTSSIPNRDYILDLADPSRPSAPGTEKRIQKHPATFQCHLCPKKFTRAYNLRSHLRTHTDERPFVCSVCSKAFARQHDRKRHEGLHSGEKKFVCRGELGTGTTWGCGRRFARADALGRHFRSEAGRVCIKPLLDEEAMERQRTVDEHMMNQNMQMGGLAPPGSMNGMNQGVFTLPAALLQQYPALQGLQWDQLATTPEDGDISGRSSFDASSGGDYYEDDDEGSGYMSDNPMNPGFETGGIWQGGQGWKSDIEV